MKKDVVLCVPTIREQCMRDFIQRWEAIGLFNHVDLIVMEDNPTPTFNLSDCFVSNQSMPQQLVVHPPTSFIHLSWKDIDEDLLSSSWIIPRRSDTVRSYAYYAAWCLGYKYIMTLDDDCYPTTREDGVVYDGEGFVNEHISNLTSKTRWFSTLQTAIPRGLPYSTRGTLDTVWISHGLWTNVVDYDAPHQLVNPTPEKFSFRTEVVPSNVYYPMCGMNVMWRASATPLMYHLLMGNRIADKDSLLFEKLPFDRFGDIWCGIFSKKILDLVQLNVTTGLPYIRHERASNPFVNLRKEANGLEVNETLWKHVDLFSKEDIHRASSGSHELDFSSTDAARSYSALGRHIMKFNEFGYGEYFDLLGQAMVKWASLFC
jgi:reversibly glycosylated polypeptide/UDP-arabinopyranose mutase